jgi:hypothetical protein
LFLFAEIGDIADPDFSNSTYVDDKDDKTPRYVAHLELIRQLLEANANARDIGEFELGKAHGRIREAIQGLAGGRILPPSHMWRKVAPTTFNTSFQLQSWVERMHGNQRRRPNAAQQTTALQTPPPLCQRKCKPKNKHFRTINKHFMQASENREKQIEARRAAVLKNVEKEGMQP